MSGTDTDRIEALERALSHQDRVVEDLNAVLTQQWTVIERLRKEVDRLRDRVGQVEYEARKSPHDDAPPPHY